MQACILIRISQRIQGRHSFSKSNNHSLKCLDLKCLDLITTSSSTSLHHLSSPSHPYNDKITVYHSVLDAKQSFASHLDSFISLFSKMLELICVRSHLVHLVHLFAHLLPSNLHSFLPRTEIRHSIAPINPHLLNRLTTIQ